MIPTEKINNFLEEATLDELVEAYMDADSNNERVALSEAIHSYKKRMYEKEKKHLEEEWQDWHDSNKTTGYSYPHWQVEALKKKYNQE